MDEQTSPPSGGPPAGGQSTPISSSFGIPVAIVIAGALIAGALYFGGGNASGGLAKVGDGNSPPPANPGPSGEFREVSNSDYILGNPDAAIAVVEYSDFECPFCSRFHPTMQRIIQENSDVKWVYRHFPLTSIHPNAQSAALAAECAGSVGGNEAFWHVADGLFANQSNLGDSLYTELASGAGININDFNNCRSSSEATAEISKDSTEAVNNGGRGTPFSIVIAPNGERLPVSGALPYESVLAVIEQARAK
jgi:protein-disulfide isomerase